MSKTDDTGGPPTLGSLLKDPRRNRLQLDEWGLFLKSRIPRKAKTPSGNSTRGVSPSSYEHSIGTQRLEVKITLRSSPVPNSSSEFPTKERECRGPGGIRTRTL